MPKGFKHFKIAAIGVLGIKDCHLTEVRPDDVKIIELTGVTFMINTRFKHYQTQRLHCTGRAVRRALRRSCTNMSVQLRDIFVKVATFPLFS